MPYRDSAFFWVYGLVDPRTDQIFYIGKGRPWRPRRHVWETQCWIRKGSNLDCSGNPLNLHKIRKIAQILKAGMEPEIKVLFRTKSAEAAYRKEKQLVKKLRPQLVNLKNGGAGSREYSMEMRKKIGDAHRGRHHSAATKALISAANKGKKLSAETRARMSAAVTKRHQEHPEQFRVPHPGRKPLSMESREKIRKTLQKQYASPEMRKVMGERARGNVLSPEARKRISEARIKWCQEHREEWLAIVRSRWEKQPAHSGNVQEGAE